MKHKALLLLIPALLLVLAGCESGARIKIFNRCSYPIYVRVADGGEVAIPANGNQAFEVETGTQTIFTGTLYEEVPIHLVGETYQIYDDNELAYTDSTSMEIQIGKTQSVYIDPNRASIKIVNNSNRKITSAEIYRNNFVSSIRVGNLTDIEAGQMRYTHVNYSVPVDSNVQPWVPTPATRYYYFVVLYDEDGNSYTFGDETNILYKDQQFLVNFTTGPLTK